MEKNIAGRLTALEAAVFRERLTQLVEHAFNGDISPEEIDEANRVSQALGIHQELLGQREMPAWVGEFRDTFTGQIGSCVLLTPGLVAAKYLEEPTSKARVMTVENWMGGVRMGVVVRTGPLDLGRIVKKS